MKDTVITYILLILFILAIPSMFIHAENSIRWQFTNLEDYIRSEINDIEVSGQAQLIRKPVYTSNNISGDTGVSYGASIADFNGDDQIDIYVVNLNAQNRLWLNDGAGSFTTSDIAGDRGETYGSTTADVDGDGDIDIYTLNQGQNKLWINDGTGAFTSSDITGDINGSTDAIFFDGDGDGDLDLYALNFDNDGDPVQNRLWINDGLGNGGASFTEDNLTDDTLGGVEVVAPDIDNDGDFDLYVATFGENTLWINDGLGNGGLSFTKSNIVGDIGDSYGVVTLDANADGNPDLYSSVLTGQNKLWINDGLGNGGTSFTANDIEGDDATTFPFSIEPLAGDFDQDGDTDIYVTNFGSQNIFWVNDGFGNFSQYGITGDGGNSYEGALFDANENGLLDLYVAVHGGQNKLWINNGDSYADLAPYIQPVDPVSINDRINHFSAEIDGATQGEVGFQISNDNGATWYYYDLGSWTTTIATDGTEVTAADDVNRYIDTFNIDDSDFLWRAYLISNGVQPVILNHVRIVYDRQDGRKSSTVRFICSDEHASNYSPSRFGRHNDSYCEYEVDDRSSSDTIQEALAIAVSDSQCPYFTTYQKKGRDNDEVKLIQAFLRELSLYQGKLDGIYGPLTQGAIDSFQAQYASRILDPWGLLSPTGYWYQSTRNMANELAGCDEGEVVLDNGFVIN